MQGQQVVDHITSRLKKLSKKEPGKNVCVDFDKVINLHKTGDPLHSIRGPLGPGIALVKLIKRLGLNPVILTARPPEYHRKISDFLRTQGVDVPVTNVKPPALMYIDDMAERWPANFGAKLKKFEKEAMENGGDGSMNMLDGRRYKSLATHESNRFREHGVKGMKWGVRKTAPEGTSVGEAPTKELTQQEKEEARDKVWAEAERQGYPTGKVLVSFDTKQFQLSGQNYNYAGSCDLKTGLITIWPQIAGAQMPGVMAHEIEHAKFQGALDKYMEERSRLIKDDRKDSEGKDVTRANGEIRDEFKKDYPITNALWESYEKPGGSTKMTEEDGVSPYSKMWWDSWKNGEAKTDQAFHETMAEMARIRFETGVLPGAPIWRKYFHVMEKVAQGRRL